MTRILPTDASIADVAERCGVSERTVSRVLNGSAAVNARTRAMVQEVIDALGYKPSARARALATGRSNLVGLIHDDPNALVLDPVQRGLTAMLGAQGIELVVHPCRYGSSDLLDDVRGFVQRSRVDGVIVLPPVSELAELHDAIAQTGTPLIAIASVPIAGADMLLPMEREAARDLTRSLIEQGHEDIAFVSGRPAFNSAQQRRLGFLDALDEAGLKPFSITAGDYSFESGLRCATEILDTANRPTAIFAANDFMAAGVLRVAHGLGIVVPDDLSVAGFDDSSIAQVVTPPLTTINRPMRTIAERAAQRLLLHLEGGRPAPSDTTQIPLSVVVRQSTGPRRAC
ncbi:LacI family transcriptional regulator [Caulobacter sp. 602-2]|uniref:LacI family transcriptional regulator n=1 Tax=Caulobacter sp. 602-2 TaxID=2710887 RepID=A0A6G4QZH6_9CAUL|nr:LacI family DNA-binding transcriptional regulator [Caulobacter sp. 602-2]NGM50867.1 LacI family transcriptional regulator [Caulobacter sp. 602-2]